MRYHISPTTGNPNICRAQPGNCPFGAEEPHYGSKEEARAGYENLQVQGPPLQKHSRSERIDRKTGYLKPEWADQVKVQDVSCPRCGSPTPPEQMTLLINNEWAYCPCKRRYDMDEMRVKLSPTNPSYRFLDKEEVKAATWYHATDKEDWLEKLDDDKPFEAHVGTEAASFDRALTEYAGHSFQGKDFILYEVKLQEDVTIADEVYRDENQKRVGDGSADVSRYINRWEDAASISLTVTSNKLVVVGKRAVTKDEAHSRLSIYNVKAPELDDDFDELYTGEEADEAYWAANPGSSPGLLSSPTT